MGHNDWITAIYYRLKLSIEVKSTIYYIILHRIPTKLTFSYADYAKLYYWLKLSMQTNANIIRDSLFNTTETLMSYYRLKLLIATSLVDTIGVQSVETIDTNQLTKSNKRFGSLYYKSTVDETMVSYFRLKLSIVAN